MPLIAADRTIATWRIRNGGFPYHLELLQLEHDTSFQTHSPFSTMSDFLEEMIDDFTTGAPRHHHLVVKAHPLEDGRVPVRRLLKTAGARTCGRGPGALRAGRQACAASRRCAQRCDGEFHRWPTGPLMRHSAQGLWPRDLCQTGICLDPAADGVLRPCRPARQPRLQMITVDIFWRRARSPRGFIHLRPGGGSCAMWSI